MAPRTPLRHPRTYFEQRGFRLAPAAAAVGVTAFALVAVLLGFGVLLSNRLAAAGHSEAAGAVWGVLAGQLVAMVVAMLVGWVLVAGVLHLLARALVNHSGSFGETMVVTGWATAPTALTTLVAFVFLALALDGASLSTPEAFVESFQANLGTTGAVSALLGFAVAVWQTYFYGKALEVEFEDASGSAWFVGGVVAFGGWLLSIV
ncbi:YIP1 family protein [Halobacterium zhouii]|uniref:YIP1 family protein n=1 Tax=Halobacterium zhouii TaxID=2902624 RepID=UPI001E5FA4D4|nr:YIP1 family protein [Halobacterium zhouii]